MAEMVITMIQSGMRDSLIYAYVRTGGMLVSESNKDRLPEGGLALWDQAMDEYERAFGH